MSLDRDQALLHVVAMYRRDPVRTRELAAAHPVDEDGRCRVCRIACVIAWAADQALHGD